MYLATGHPMLYHPMRTSNSQRAGEGSQIFQIHVNDVIFTSFAPCGSVRNIRHAANHGNPAMHCLGPQDHEHSPAKSDLLPRNAAASKCHQNHRTRASPRGHDSNLSGDAWQPHTLPARPLGHWPEHLAQLADRRFACWGLGGELADILNAPRLRTTGSKRSGIAISHGGAIYICFAERRREDMAIGDLAI